MKLKEVRKVSFDELTHSYWAGDNELIGVTGLMKKHGLSADYSGIPPEVLAAAAAKGTALHRLLEAYDNGEPYTPCRTTEDYAKLHKLHIASEYLVTDGKTVASSIDKVYETDTPDEVELNDVKTTATLHRRSLQWQLGIYKYLFERQNRGLRVVRCTVTQFDKNSGALKAYEEVEPVTEREVKALLDADRKGTLYLDEVSTPSASLALSGDELASYQATASKIATLKEALTALEDVRKTLEAKVLEYMLEHSIDEMAASEGVFKMKKAYLRSTIDTARLKKEMPEIAEKYTKTSETAASLLWSAL